jgi:hypothetical protein
MPFLTSILRERLMGLNAEMRRWRERAFSRAGRDVWYFPPFFFSSSASVLPSKPYPHDPFDGKSAWRIVTEIANLLLT